MTTTKVEQKIMFVANEVKESFTLKKKRGEKLWKNKLQTLLGPQKWGKIGDDDKKRELQYKEKIRVSRE